MGDRKKSYLRTSRKTVPGYPWKGKFRTRAEIEAYFSGETIQCLLCGHWFKQITHLHLVRIHGVTPDEYRRLFGLPPAREMSGMLKRGGARGPDEAERRRTWRRKDYEAILERMRVWKRSLGDVCRDPDMPGKNSWLRYIKKHPGFAEKARKIHHTLPYSEQIGCKDVSPRFRHVCLLLLTGGVPRQGIAKALGVSPASVYRLFRELEDDIESPPISHACARSRNEYEKVLERMRAQRRPLVDVCGDPDLPSHPTCWRRMKKHPGFAKKVHRLHHRLSYSVQLLIHDVSPRFRIDCQRLRVQNISQDKIAKILGVSESPVYRVLRGFDYTYNPEDRRKWRRRDLEGVLSRMREQKRALTDVCGDPDMPSYSLVLQHMKEDPEFAERVREAFYSLPYALQFKYRKVSPRFYMEFRRLRDEGKLSREIAEALGVSRTIARNEMKKLNRKMGLPESLPGERIKWSVEDYEAILDRMKKQRRTLADVCGDPDLPPRGAWLYFIKKHPEFGMLAKRIHHRLPYSEQIRIRDFSPRFYVDCRRLRAAGMSFKKIGEALDVSDQTVRTTLNSKRKSPPKG